MAASRFFATVELLEHLLALPELISDIRRLKQVSRLWRNVIEDSTKLNWRLFDRPKSRPSLAQDDIPRMVQQIQTSDLETAGVFVAHPLWDEHAPAVIMWPECWTWTCLMDVGEVRRLVNRREWYFMEQYAFQPPVNSLTIFVEEPNEENYAGVDQILRDVVTDPMGLRVGAIVDALRFLDSRTSEHQHPWELSFHLDLNLSLGDLVQIGTHTSSSLNINQHTPTARTH